MRELCPLYPRKRTFVGGSSSPLSANSRHRPSLFDHLAGAREHSGRHGEAEGFCRLEVDRKLVLGRRLYRQLGWLLALEDAINVAGRLSVLVDKIRSIGDEPTNGDEEAIGVDGGQSEPGGERNDQIAMARRQRTRRHDQAV